jgi:hypothetical protein
LKDLSVTSAAIAVQRRVSNRIHAVISQAVHTLLPVGFEGYVNMERSIQPGLKVAGRFSALMYAITSSISLGVNRWPKGGMARFPSRMTARACRKVGCGLEKNIQSGWERAKLGPVGVRDIERSHC